MSLAKRLLSELMDAARKGRSVDAFYFPQDTMLDDGQEVEPVCSTYTDEAMVNIYRVVDGDKPVEFIYSTNDVGGKVDGCGGPFSSIEAAKSEFGEVEEGWTDF